ncbi:unnamed protein product [Hymenolepis diminuta]|uniref:Uncharacterized protein n=1 Tax=Hymenolepis diminuta TaxID=6216 RepID=A0A564Z9H2_HYMDI|nr:unnamed protein product [Hymenolepis diminuta]
MVIALWMVVLLEALVNGIKTTLILLSANFPIISFWFFQIIFTCLRFILIRISNFSVHRMIRKPDR